MRMAPGSRTRAPAWRRRRRRIGILDESRASARSLHQPPPLAPWRAIAALFLVAVLPASVACRRGPPSQPNIVVIAVEGLSVRLGSYGGGAQTPAADRLAREGRRFDRAYRQYPESCASRTSWLSGRRPESTRVLGEAATRDQLGRAWIPLPQRLQ